jgi:hypothetical protein
MSHCVGSSFAGSPYRNRSQASVQDQHYTIMAGGHTLLCAHRMHPCYSVSASAMKGQTKHGRHHLWTYSSVEPEQAAHAISPAAPSLPNGATHPHNAAGVNLARAALKLKRLK